MSNHSERMFNLGRRQGAIDIIEALRGKIPAALVLEILDRHTAEHPIDGGATNLPVITVETGGEL